ncbi:hypothetical protein HPB51_027896 [Rhipicephalus microplus]|uniref:Uncharacterized protein n=1 Tax=Rhipicephalus microplus TaxID=6941 RepID=A0A9J6CZA0_RHIMP|nr:hypothetical protein HPB51_027896 [Rhipicephalus microplus]
MFSTPVRSPESSPTRQPRVETPVHRSSRRLQGHQPEFGLLKGATLSTATPTQEIARSPAQAGTNCINLEHYVYLYEAEKDSHLKIVPMFTSSHVKPSKLEKMNVRLATQSQAPPHQESTVASVAEVVRHELRQAFASPQQYSASPHRPNSCTYADAVRCPLAPDVSYQPNGYSYADAVRRPTPMPAPQYLEPKGSKSMRVLNLFGEDCFFEMN